MRIRLPRKVNDIIVTITEAGYEAYAVGGCVRDSVLGQEPDDWDITTSALPMQVKALFKRTADTGIQHGTVTVLMQKEAFEVTTYRIDGDYEDSRHPKEVKFTPNLTEDLKRRDFTMNAMAYNDKEGLVDEFDGLGDLKRGVVRCVGEAGERFSEDALRILRAVRFAAKFGFRIESRTKEAIVKLAPTLQNISAERIQTELVKLIISDHPEYLHMAYEAGITKVILPEFDRMMETMQQNPHHDYSVGEHTLYAMRCIRADKILRLSMLFHDIGKPDTKQRDETGVDHFYGHAVLGQTLTRNILKRLKFDNETIDKVTRLVRFHDYRPELTSKHIRRAIAKVGEDIFPSLLLVKQADLEAQSDFLRQEKEEALSRLKELYDGILADEDCISLKTLAVSGNDLIAMGMKPGKEIGDTLKALLEIVMDDPSHNTKDYLLKHTLQV